MAHSVGLIWNILKVTLNPITKTIMKLLPYSDNLGFRKWTPWMAPIAFYVLSRLLVLSCNGLTRDGLCRFCCLCSFYHPESFFFFFSFNPSQLFSPPSCVWLNLHLTTSSHKTFSLKRFLVKIQKQSHPILNGFKWKLAIKSGTPPREDVGGEPSWVYKKPHAGVHTFILC